MKRSMLFLLLLIGSCISYAQAVMVNVDNRNGYPPGPPSPVTLTFIMEPIPCGGPTVMFPVTLGPGITPVGMLGGPGMPLIPLNVTDYRIIGIDYLGATVGVPLFCWGGPTGWPGHMGGGGPGTQWDLSTDLGLGVIIGNAVIAH
ncbi:hypothetical protein [Taibaiella chishuiensis]|uniref:Uncharacterized protein n=1 Tax=Taibaiella chishuiensis TaxID=1434707 RepID=A0A2P8D0K4_9BACT|nr:hypothetical protein [Taibaiella chishuiensis]PSK90744.1 hypothetical protein B0I18_107154 [Taibaiella chishuiensis]